MRTLLIAGLFLATTGLAVAQSEDVAPEEVVIETLETFYAPYLADEIPEDQSDFFSLRLNGLYDRDAELTPEGEMGAIEFDPFIDGQDFAITDFVVDAVEVEGNMATADVSFANFGEPRSLTYDLVLQEDGWKIDDVISTSPDNEYRLSQIFAEAAQDQVVEPRADNCADDESDSCSITFPE